MTGGNVSFYNQTGTTRDPAHAGDRRTRRDRRRHAAHPVRRSTPTARQIFLLGETRDEFGGSEWTHVVHGFLGGRPPLVDLERERLLADVLIDCSRDGLIDSAHDLSDGGLAQALVECCLRHGIGASLELPEGLDPFVALFASRPGERS